MFQIFNISFLFSSYIDPVAKQQVYQTVDEWQPCSADGSMEHSDLTNQVTQFVLFLLHLTSKSQLQYFFDWLFFISIATIEITFPMHTEALAIQVWHLIAWLATLDLKVYNQTSFKNLLIDALAISVFFNTLFQFFLSTQSQSYLIF